MVTDHSRFVICDLRFVIAIVIFVFRSVGDRNPDVNQET